VYFFLSLLSSSEPPPLPFSPANIVFSQLEILHQKARRLVVPEFSRQPKSSTQHPFPDFRVHRPGILARVLVNRTRSLRAHPELLFNSTSQDASDFPSDNR
jgi:hypothetical protein